MEETPVGITKEIIRDLLLIISGALIGFSVGYWVSLVNQLVTAIMNFLNVSEHQANVILIVISIVLFAVAMRIRRNVS